MAYGYDSYNPGAGGAEFSFPSRRRSMGGMNPLEVNSFPQSGARFAQPNAEAPQFAGQEDEQGPSTLDRILGGVGQGLAGGGILPMLLQNFARNGEEDDEEQFRRFGGASAYTPNF